MSAPARESWAPVATLPRELRAALGEPAMRQTAGVMMELIDGAREEILLATPYVDDAAVGALTESLLAARARGVHLTILTSIGRAPYFATLDLVDPRQVYGGLVITEVTTETSPLGSHAKVLVVDRGRAYVGSANLTAAGIGRNIEIGVEVAGHQVDELARLLVALERLGDRIATSADRRTSF